MDVHGVHPWKTDLIWQQKKEDSKRKKKTMRRTVRLWSVDEESEDSPVVEEAEGEQEPQPEEEENATAEEEGAADEGEGTEEHDEGVESWNATRRALAYNPHFPNSNQTKHCWSSYVNYHQCVKLKGAV